MWLLIAQAFSRRVNDDSEELRSVLEYLAKNLWRLYLQILAQLIMIQQLLAKLV